MKHINRNLLWAALLLCAANSPVFADEFSLTTEALEGEHLTLALNAGVEATLIWDGEESTSENFIFNGDFQEIPVKGKELKITTQQPVTVLFCSNNKLVELSVSTLKSLQTLVCNDNNISNISLYSNGELREISLQRNVLQSLSLESNRKVESLNLAQNPLKTLTVSSLPDLKTVNIAQTELTQFNVTKSSNLEKLFAQESSLKSINASGPVETVCAYDSQLETLNLSNTAAVKNFWASDNKLSTLDLESAKKLADLVVERNDLRGISLSSQTRSTLKNFFVSDNELMFNSFPTQTTSMTAELTPQRNYMLNQTVGVDESVVLDDLVLRNAWGEYLKPTYVWKLKSDDSVIPETDWKNTRNAEFSFSKPFGDVYCEVSMTKYPDIVLKVDGIHVGDATGISSSEYDSECQITGGENSIRIVCSSPCRIAVVRPDGKFVRSEKVQAGTYEWAMPKGIYIVNNKKVLVN